MASLRRLNFLFSLLFIVSVLSCKPETKEPTVSGVWNLDVDFTPYGEIRALTSIGGEMSQKVPTSLSITILDEEGPRIIINELESFSSLMLNRVEGRSDGLLQGNNIDYGVAITKDSRGLEMLLTVSHYAQPGDFKLIKVATYRKP